MADWDYSDDYAPPPAAGRERKTFAAQRGAGQGQFSAPQPMHQRPAAWSAEPTRRYAGHAPVEPDLPSSPLMIRGQKAVNIAGAVGSVVLVLGLIWWGYDLAMRDLRGVPVVRAMEGPMRIAPEEPGGEVVDHQGLAVNDVAAEGGAAAPADRLILAPVPVELSLEDGPGLAGESPPAEEIAPASLAAAAEPALSADTDAAVDAALAEALGEVEAQPEDVVEVAQLDDAGNPPPEGAITRSLRPMPRPEGRAPAAVAAAPAEPTVIDPATLAPGTRLVQFGAFDSADLAKAEWMRLAGRFGDLMVGKSMVIQTAESGGKTFYRLRGHGFENEDDARRFCSALVAEGSNCIPVAQR